MELFASVDPKRVDEFEGKYGSLDLPACEVDKIKKNYQSPIQRKEAYLDLYVHQHPCPSWQQVVKVLRRYPFAHNQEADFVENSYVKGTQNTVDPEIFVLYKFRKINFRMFNFVYATGRQCCALRVRNFRNVKIS